MHALPVKFHWKSLFPGNWLMPAVFLGINIFVTSNLITMAWAIKDDVLL